jgi:hypothetical protein
MEELQLKPTYPKIITQKIRRKKCTNIGRIGDLIFIEKNILRAGRNFM